MAETKIVIHDVHVHPETGHTTYTLKAETTEGTATWTGPVKQYGVDPQMLRDRFNGDISQFEKWAANEHKSIIGAHPEYVDKMMKRKGCVIE